MNSIAAECTSQALRAIYSQHPWRNRIVTPDKCCSVTIVAETGKGWIVSLQSWRLLIIEVNDIPPPDMPAS